MLTDLHIKDNDLVFDALGEPVLIKNEAVVTQDLIHRLRESGVLLELLGELDPVQIELTGLKIIRLLEEDNRIEPGRTTAAKKDNELFFTAIATSGAEIQFKI